MRVFSEQEYKAIRIANIALLLQGGKTLTTVELVRRFQVSRRTAQRDLECAGRILPLVQAYKTVDGMKRPCWRMFDKEQV